MPTESPIIMPPLVSTLVFGFVFGLVAEGIEHLLVRRGVFSPSQIRKQGGRSGVVSLCFAFWAANCSDEPDTERGVP